MEKFKIKEITQLNMEVFGGCNLACPMCPQGIEGGREKEFKKNLHEELFKKIVDEAIPMGLKYVNLSGSGEPLLNRKLEEFVKSFRDGIHTIIGEEGIRVSGGEAQRINIARTIYLNRKFIFFDESLNNLDMVTSKKILKNLKELNNSQTIFFITHDLRLLIDFEEVLIFNNGEIVENGSYSKLQGKSKLFMELSDSAKLKNFD